ncbi:MAG: RNA polymerase sigma factor [Bacteroidota bacterium]
MDDRQLVEQFLKTKSEKAFRQLYRERTPHLYQMALRLTQDDSLSDELIQEMWVIAIRKLAEFQWRSALKTWLTGILVNLYRNHRKANEKMDALADEDSVEVSSELTFSNAHDLEAGIAQLPPGYRQIIILHDVEGYKHREIAQLLDITEGTSKSQLFHARKTLRTFLSEDSTK